MNMVEIKSLSVNYEGENPVHAIRDVSFSIGENEFVGLVGESGSGKSTLGHAVARLEQEPAKIVEGDILIGDKRWTDMTAKELRLYRWTDIAIVLQSGMNALNPVRNIISQFRDVMKQHIKISNKNMQTRFEEVLQMVHISPIVLKRYPHELSGGMRQRVIIAMSLLLHPKLLILDEPTTALDMVVQRQIVENLKSLKDQENFSVLFISHDLGLILELADRVMVMYAGQIVEEQSAEQLLQNPLHPYTDALLKAMPSIRSQKFDSFSIQGSPPDLRHLPEGCSFAPRCPIAEKSCVTQGVPPLYTINDGTSKFRCYVTRRGYVPDE